MLLVLFQQGLSAQEIAYLAIIVIFAMTLSFSFHEFMHAAVAVWLGDETPRNMGRLTLNPLAHIDPVGVVLLLLAGFGWGKPVMYNPNRLNRLKSHRLMNIMVHLAGVTGNFVIALIANIIAMLFAALTVRFENMAIVFKALFDLFSYTHYFSLLLLAFNLIPIPPLDGFHVLEELLPVKVRYSDGYKKFQRFSPYIIFVVFLVSRFSSIPLLSTLVELIERPFAALIDLISTPFYLLLQFMGLL